MFQGHPKGRIIGGVLLALHTLGDLCERAPTARYFLPHDSCGNFRSVQNHVPGPSSSHGILGYLFQQLLLEALRRGFINQEFLIVSISNFGWSFNFLEMSIRADKWSWLILSLCTICLHWMSAVIGFLGVSGETGSVSTMSRPIVFSSH